MKALAARRHDRRAPIVLLLLALLLTGGLYAVLAPTSADAAPCRRAPTTSTTGEKLFQANCATCHGPAASGTDERPVPHRRRRRGRRLPGRHRPHAHADERPAGPGQAGPVRRRSRSTSSPRSSRRWAPARRSPPRSRSTRRWATSANGMADLPHQLRDVPQRRRRRRRALPGQVRAEPVGDHAHAPVRGHADRPAVDARVQRREHHARGEARHHRVHRRSRAAPPPAASTSARSAR